VWEYHGESIWSLCMEEEVSGIKHMSCLWSLSCWPHWGTGVEFRHLEGSLSIQGGGSLHSVMVTKPQTNLNRALLSNSSDKCLLGGEGRGGGGGLTCLSHSGDNSQIHGGRTICLCLVEISLLIFWVWWRSWVI